MPSPKNHVGAGGQPLCRDRVARLESNLRFQDAARSQLPNRKTAHGVAVRLFQKGGRVLQPAASNPRLRRSPKRAPEPRGMTVCDSFQVRCDALHLRRAAALTGP